MRVLVVDDDVRTAAFIRKGLTQAGFVVEHEADGQDALHRALAEPYDAAVIDSMLPSQGSLFRNMQFSVVLLHSLSSVGAFFFF
ncbi:MAG: response regulator [Nitrospiraceae bacterium]